MEQAILTGALAISVALLNPSSVSHLENKNHTNQQEMRDYSVEEGDSINSIAEKVYGSGDYESIIIKDNTWITDPNHIEKGWLIKIRSIRPPKPKPNLLTQDINTQNSMPEKNIVNEIASSEINLTPTPQQTTPIPQSNNQTLLNGPLNEAQINFLGNCEAGMNATRNSGNGYYGAFQFSYGTWQRMETGYERADLAPLEVQIAAVQKLLSRSSIFHQFPSCARRMQEAGLI